MLSTKTVCFSKSGAAFHLAHFRLATAVLDTETLASRGGDAARHGARLVLASTVPLAMRFFSSSQTSGATCKLALSIRAVLGAETV